MDQRSRSFLAHETRPPAASPSRTGNASAFPYARARDRSLLRLLCDDAVKYGAVTRETRACNRSSRGDDAGGYATSVATVRCRARERPRDRRSRAPGLRATARDRLAFSSRRDRIHRGSLAATSASSVYCPPVLFLDPLM